MTFELSAKAQHFRCNPEASAIPTAENQNNDRLFLCRKGVQVSCRSHIQRVVGDCRRGGGAFTQEAGFQQSLLVTQVPAFSTVIVPSANDVK